MCDTDLQFQFAWQGLANVDPDVDAIYQLTQPLNIVFNANSPSVVLPKGIMAPLSSQNTLYASEALWSLMLPVTPTFRCPLNDLPLLFSAKFTTFPKSHVEQLEIPVKLLYMWTYVGMQRPTFSPIKAAASRAPFENRHEIYNAIPFMYFTELLMCDRAIHESIRP